MSVRQALLVLNAVAIGVIIIVIAARVISLRRNPEPTPAPNKTPFLDDGDLEGRRLERVGGLALLCTVVIALALPIYFLVEPDRQVSLDADFEEDSAERGAVLFANEASPAFDPTRSLLCANCHGVDGQGGTAPFTIKPEDPSCDPNAEITEATPVECRPVRVNWTAPPLDVAGLRYDRAALTQIITYGRPGTPMPAWGVVSGEGVLNEQSIDDLVNYVESLQISPDKAKARFSTEAIRKKAQEDADDAQTAVEEAQAALAAAPTDQQEAAQEALATAQQQADATAGYNAQVQATADGALLFQAQCARCHTKGWSYYDPLDPDAAPLPGPMGGGAFGPNLTGGAEARQFPGATGIEQQILFVAQGVAPNKAYGVRGIASGRMPHFNETLTEEQIRQIVDYERTL
jgi:mono/diheme cytochrome c family protein